MDAPYLRSHQPFSYTATTQPSIKRQPLKTIDLSSLKEETEFRTHVPLGPILLFKEMDINNLFWKGSILLATRGDYDSKGPLLEMEDSHQNYYEIKPNLLDQVEDLTFWRYDLVFKPQWRTSEIVYLIAGKIFSFFLAGLKEDLIIGAVAGIGNLTEAKDLECLKDALDTCIEKRVHLSLGMGHQINAEGVFKRPLLSKWLQEKNYQKRLEAPFTDAMRRETIRYYLEEYCRIFSISEVRSWLAKIPQLMLMGDGEIFPGWSTLPLETQDCPVMRGVFSIAIRFFFLVQQAVLISNAGEEGYIKPTASFVKPLGQFSRVALIGVDMQSEARQDRIISVAVLNELSCAIRRMPKKVQHIVLLMPDPLLYPVLAPDVQRGDVFGRGSIGKAILSNGSPIEVAAIKSWQSSERIQQWRELLETLHKIVMETGQTLTVLSSTEQAGILGCLNSKDDKHKMMQIVMPFISYRQISPNVKDALEKAARQRTVVTETLSMEFLAFATEEYLLTMRSWCILQSRGNTHSLVIDRFNYSAPSKQRTILQHTIDPVPIPTPLEVSQPETVAQNGCCMIV